MTNDTKTCDGPDQMAIRVRPAVSAIYGIFDTVEQGEDDGGELVGTGLFVKVRDRIGILTAAHVANKKEELTAAGLRRFEALAHSTTSGSPPAFITSNYLCLGPPEDLAFALADADALRATSVVPINYDQFDDTPETGDFFLLGFPAKDSKFLRLLGGIQSTALPFLSQRATSSDPYFDPRVHFALHYSYPDPSEDACGNPRQLPDPAGVSGSPVWSVSSLSGEAPNWRVVGVVQRHDPVAHVLIVTRGAIVKGYLDVVRREFAQL